MYVGRKTNVIHGITERQQEGQKEETAGELFTHIENVRKKYFMCLSKIRTPIIYIYVQITLQILRNIIMLNFCI
jgi:hypothetical protein